MFTLDSDLLGILLAILTFLVPAISALFEKKRRKEKGEADNLPDAMAEEDLFTFVLGDETEVELQEPVKEQYPVEHVQTVQPEQPKQKVQPLVTGPAKVEKKVSEVVPQESCESRKSLKERIKENPEDMILFSEILKPKFKEY